MRPVLPPGGALEQLHSTFCSMNEIFLHIDADTGDVYTCVRNIRLSRVELNHWTRMAAKPLTLAVIHK